jgi:hypothetical protein
MPANNDTRSAEQDVAAGQSESTPVRLMAFVVGIVGLLFLLALGLAALAYYLA